MADAVIIDCTAGTQVTAPLSPADQNVRANDATVGASLAQTQATQAANATTLQQRAQNALATNTTYLGLASPTTTQVAAQVKVLTQECSALIRLLLGLLDSTS